MGETSEDGVLAIGSLEKGLLRNFSGSETDKVDQLDATGVITVQGVELHIVVEQLSSNLASKKSLNLSRKALSEPMVSAIGEPDCVRMYLQLIASLSHIKLS